MPSRVLHCRNTVGSLATPGIGRAPAAVHPNVPSTVRPQKGTGASVKSLACLEPTRARPSGLTPDAAGCACLSTTA